MSALPQKISSSPRKTATWWATFDAEFNEKFPTNSLAKIRSRNGIIVQVQILTDSRKGKREVINPISGKQYKIRSDSVLQLTSLPTEELKKKAERIHHEIVSSAPVVLREGSPARIMPLTPDEMILHTTLSATTKALKNVRARSSVRNPKLLDLVLAATSCLETCLNELESYKQLPLDA